MSDKIDINKCNTCSCEFGSDGVYRQSASNRKWLATLDDEGFVIQECCEACALEAEG